MRVELHDGVVVGFAVGVDDDGRLQVDPDGGGDRLSVAAGDVVHLARNLTREVSGPARPR